MNDFNRAFEELKNGNPHPIIGGKFEFPDQQTKSRLQHFAFLMNELIDSIESKNATQNNLKLIEQIFIKNEETKNIPLAKQYLKKLISSCSINKDAHKKLLQEVDPTCDADKEIESIVVKNEVLKKETEALLNSLLVFDTND